MTWRRLSAMLCLLNWLACGLFLFTRKPNIDNSYELERAEDGTTFMPIGSGRAAFHIAGRPINHWNSWHGGETPLVKLLGIVNFPALAIARASAPSITRLLFRHSGSYSLESWVIAWIFLLLATAQWIGVGWLMSKGRLYVRRT